MSSSKLSHLSRVQPSEEPFCAAIESSRAVMEPSCAAMESSTRIPRTFGRVLDVSSLVAVVTKLENT